MIKILPQNLADKIAAGEVVERPASVLKELLENSIDAHAKNIKVYIDRLNIRVDDDGLGMNKEEILLSVKRFATSKIFSEKDLDNISTFGFRGEALPSIASVSRLSIVSKTEGLDYGYKVDIEGGEIKSIEESASLKGTSINVSDIFFNTPARLKFLKSLDTEYRYIEEIFKSISLSYPSIHFEFYKNSKRIYNYMSTDLYNRFISILPKGDRNFFDVDVTLNDISLKGFLAKPLYTRSSRDLQYIFVNNRAVNSNIISKAINEGYSNFIPQDRFPIYTLFINMPSFKVDVNAHPRKIEVRFKNTNEIFSLIRSSVNKIVTNEKYSQFKPSENNILQINSTLKNYSFSTPNNSYSTQRVSNYENKSIFSLDNIETINENIPVFQIFSKYIITVFENKLQIIDQHAASERVMYEQIMNDIKLNKIESQNFIIPYDIDLNKKDFVLISSFIEILKGYGIEIEIFGDSSIKISSIPLVLINYDIEKLIKDILADLEYADGKSENILLDKISATIACHSSIRFGDYLDNIKMQKIIIDLRKTKNPFFCPHGRPTTFEMEELELLKKFYRK